MLPCEPVEQMSLQASGPDAPLPALPDDDEPLDPEVETEG
jgi:hypothetical protein